MLVLFYLTSSFKFIEGKNVRLYVKKRENNIRQQTKKGTWGVKRKGVEKVFVKKLGLAETFCGCLWVITWPVSLRTVGIYIAICSYCRASKVCTPLTHDLFIYLFVEGMGWWGVSFSWHQCWAIALLSSTFFFPSLPLVPIKLKSIWLFIVQLYLILKNEFDLQILSRTTELGDVHRK